MGGLAGRWTRSALLAGGLLAGWAHAAAPPWSELPTDPQARRGEVRVDLLPELGRRKAEASARRDALERVERGEAGLAEAAPELDAAELASVPAIEARLLDLDRRGVARADDRRAAPPDLDDARLSRALAVAWTAALDAEEEADEAERRVLYALQGWLGRLPAWTASAQAAARAPLDAAYAAAEQAVQSSEGAARAEALQTLGRLDAARTRWAVLARTARDAAIAGRLPGIELTPEIEALGAGDPLLARDARARLALLLPSVGEEEAARGREALAAWLGGPALEARKAELEAWVAPPAADPGIAQQGVDEARAAVAAARDARARWAAAAGEDDPVTAAERALADVDVQLAERRLALAQEQLTSLSAAHAAQAADEARQAADKARAATGDHPAVDLRTASREWSAEAYAAVQVLSEALDEARDARRADLATLLGRTRTIQAAVDEGRPQSAGTSPDETYALVRAWISQLRGSLLAVPEELVPEGVVLPVRPDPAPRVAQLQAWTEQAQALPDEAVRAELLPLLADTRDAIDAEAVPLAEAAARLAQARADRLEDLRVVKELKHRLRALVSPAERGIDRATFGTDLVAEVRLLGVQGVALLRERGRWLWGLPAAMVDLNRLGGATRRLLWSLALMVGWLVLRRRKEHLADRLLDGGERVGVPMNVRARAALRPLVAEVVLPVVDGLAAALLAPSAAALAPEFGIALRALGWSAVFGALRAGVPVLFALPGEQRPALLVVDDDELQLARRTWTTVGVWWVAGFVLERVLSELMFADTVGDVTGVVIDLVGLVLLVALLTQWDARLLHRVRRLGRPPDWLRRLTARDRLGPLAPLRAMALGGYLAAAIVWDLLQGTAAQQDGYRALVSVMDRVRFGGEAEEEAEQAAGAALDEGRLRDLVGGDVPSEVLVARPKVETAVLEQLDGWRRDRRRGVLVLTGDRGDGKGVVLQRIASQLVVDELDAHMGRLDHRLETAEAARAFLAAFVGLPEVPPDDDALVERILALPPRVHVVRRAQRAFLRRVGGFDALRTLFYVCNATSERHFWILGVHRPAWGYLSRISSLVNAGVVRGVVDVAPLTGPELRELVLRRTRHAGLEVDFRRLENTGPFGAPPDEERERAIQSYFRVLAEGSGGCPTIALSLWARSLRPRADGVVDVVVVPELAGRRLDDVPVLQLFVLAALRIHEELTLTELAAVIDADAADVRADARELVQRGVITLTDGHARVETLWLRGVTTVLRRRHILQWAA